MDEIFISIMERLAEKTPQLSLIDEDYGQLETEQDTYPVTFPCALISNPESEWQDFKQSAQRADSSITVRVAIDCYDDTHYSSETYGRIRERCSLVHDVIAALRDFIPNEFAGRMRRTRSTSYTLPGGIKVYETTFRMRSMEQF